MRFAVAVLVSSILGLACGFPLRVTFPDDTCPGTTGDDKNQLRCTIHNRTPYSLKYRGSNFSAGGLGELAPGEVEPHSAVSLAVAKVLNRLGQGWLEWGSYSGVVGFQAQLPRNQTLDFILGMSDPVLFPRQSGVAFTTSIDEASLKLDSDPYALLWHLSGAQPVRVSTADPRDIFLSAAGRSCCFEFALASTRKVTVWEAPDKEVTLDALPPPQCDHMCGK